jgi:transcriptional regulator with XRE-family HTH domain
MADPSTAKRIRLRRQALGLTQQQLADELRVNRATVSAWERGKQAPDKHEGRIEAVLGISLSGDPPVEEYTDPTERALWALKRLPEPLRREFIARSRAYPPAVGVA